MNLCSKLLFKSDLKLLRPISLGFGFLSSTWPGACPQLPSLGQEELLKDARDCVVQLTSVTAVFCCFLFSFKIVA